jgi:hypothetical protein
LLGSDDYVCQSCGLNTGKRKLDHLKHSKAVHKDLYEELLNNQRKLHKNKAQPQTQQVHEQNEELLQNKNVDDEELTEDQMLELAIANISDEVKSRETQILNFVDKFFFIL